MGYGILIRLGEFNLRLLSRECPRVHQVEAAGGLEAFLARYLKQVADFTYNNAPHEQDAEAHELTAWPTPDRSERSVWKLVTTLAYQTVRQI